MFPKKPVTIREVYLDYAAATPVSQDVLAVMMPYFSDCFANPSTLYAAGVAAREAVEQSRCDVASSLCTQPDTIVFTSGGTESCNLALFGLLSREQGKNKHIITTKVEHKAVLGPIKQLVQEGYSVTYLDVDETGQIDIAQFRKALRPETVLVSIMYVNNELGTVYPVQDIGKEILKWRKKHNSVFPYYHIDACQATLYFDVSVERLHVDLLSVNGSKIYGPKGIGALYVRRGVAIDPIMVGGGQEHGLRSGTEHVPGIVGFGQAMDNRQHNDTTVRELRDYFWKEIERTIEAVQLNGIPICVSDYDKYGSCNDGDSRSPNNVHVWFHGVEAETLALYLSEYGIMVGIGSACTTGTDEDSHVLAACGFTKERITESVRFTLGAATTKEDIDYVVTFLPGIVEHIRVVQGL